MRGGLGRWSERLYGTSFLAVFARRMGYLINEAGEAEGEKLHCVVLIYIYISPHSFFPSVSFSYFPPLNIQDVTRCTIYTRLHGAESG